MRGKVYLILFRKKIEFKINESNSCIAQYFLFRAHFLKVESEKVREKKRKSEKNSHRFKNRAFW